MKVAAADKARGTAATASRPKRTATLAAPAYVNLTSPSPDKAMQEIGIDDDEEGSKMGRYEMRVGRASNVHAGVMTCTQSLQLMRCHHITTLQVDGCRGGHCAVHTA